MAERTDAGVLSRVVLQLPVVIVVAVTVAGAGLYFTTAVAAVAGLVVGLGTAVVIAMTAASVTDD